MPQFEIKPDGKAVELSGLVLEASTLGELLIELERQTGAKVVPDETQAKYFRYYTNHESSEWVLVDIHIQRSGEDICPKQDLDFALLPNDKIVPGPLAC